MCGHTSKELNSTLLESFSYGAYEVMVSADEDTIIVNQESAFYR